MPVDSNGNKKSINEVHDVHEFHEHDGRRWPVTLLYLGAAFLVALVVVFGGRWVYRSVINSDSSSLTGTTNSGSKKAGSTTKDSENGAVIVPATPSQGSVSTPKTTPAPATAPSKVPATGDELPNTGG